LLSLWRRRLSASFGRFLLEQSFQTALNGSLSHGAGNVADVGLRFRARKFSGQIEWDLKPALIIGEILALLCAADDVLGKLLGQQEQGAKINGVVECEPALSLRFEFRRGNRSSLYFLVRGTLKRSFSTYRVVILQPVGVSIHLLY